MKTLFSERIASNTILLLLSLVVVFHVCIVLGIIPYQIVWGGRLQNHSQMLTFEAISISLNLVMLMVIAINAGYLKVKVKQAFLTAALWSMAILFALNTLGNLFAINELEKLIFTPITFLLAVCCIRLAIAKKPKLQPEPVKN